MTCLRNYPNYMSYDVDIDFGHKNKSILGFAVAIVLVLLYFVDPAELLLPMCFLHWSTGLHCPTCGATRAVHQLVNGNMIEAFVLNPLVIVSIPVLALILLKPKWFSKKWIIFLAGGVIAAYAIARNIPYEPFIFLSPN